MNTSIPFVLPLLCLVACSGGSEGGALADPIPTAQISEANAATTATIAVGTSFGLTDAIAIAANQLNAALQPGENIVYGPEAGQVVVTLDDRDGSGDLTSGDTCVLAFESHGAMTRLFEGEVAIDQIVLQGQVSDFLPHVMRARLRLDLSITHGVKVFPATGVLELRREQRSTVRISEAVVSGLATFGDTVVLPGSRFRRDDYPADFSFAWFIDASVQASGVGGWVDVGTTIPFVGVESLPAPWAGRLEVRGSSSHVSVEIVDFTGGMEIAVDADDDGVAEQRVDTTWDTLLGGV